MATLICNPGEDPINEKTGEKIPPRPTTASTYDWERGSWIDPRTPQQALDDQWEVVRAERDGILTATDWRSVRASETGASLSGDWLDYRQALRDITEQSDPFNISWPSIPADI